MKRVDAFPIKGTEALERLGNLARGYVEQIEGLMVGMIPPTTDCCMKNANPSIECKNCGFDTGCKRYTRLLSGLVREAVLQMGEINDG